MQEVDVVVVSYNSAATLRACVEPLTALRPLNVVVVDSASRDGSLSTIADLPVRAEALQENHGFAHACNVGLRMGAAPFVLFLNPDATVDEESIGRLVAVADSDPSIGIVAPRILEGDGSLDFSMRRFPRLRTTYAQALFLHRLFPRAEWSDELVRDEAAYERAASPDWISGACFLARRSVLEIVGGFDDGFFMYCEDIDLCRRVRKAGFDIRFAPDATAVHEGGGSAPRSGLLPVLAESRIRYARKHQTRLAAALERGGVALGALTHAVLTRGGAEARRGHAQAAGRALAPAREPGSRP